MAFHWLGVMVYHEFGRLRLWHGKFMAFGSGAVKVWMMLRFTI